MRVSKSWAMATMAAGVIAATAGGVAGPAAASDLLTCEGTTSQHYSPGLTLTEQPVSITNTTTFTPCVGTASISSGASSGSSSGSASCILNAPTTTTSVINWNDGTSSTTVTNNTVTRTLGETIILAPGTVTAGRFAGASVLKVITFLNPNPLLCLGSPGVTDVSGPITMAITS